MRATVPYGAGCAGESKEKAWSMGLKDKVVLITGGGGGIARGIERAFATEGAKFILTDLFPGGLEAAKEELERDFGSEVFTILANGSVEEEVRAAVEAAPSTSAGASTS